jgi:type VI secretion system secreted protein Hcp
MRIPMGLLSGAMAAIFCLASPASPALGADKHYVKFEGTKQGQFKGEAPRSGGGWIEIQSFSQAVVSPRDASTGQASGKREHNPITIVKQVDVSSPQLSQAARSNELMREVLIQSVRTEPSGKEQVYQTIQLTNATVTSVERMAGGARNESERITLIYQKIQVTDSKGGVTATDNWIAPK